MLNNCVTPCNMCSMLIMLAGILQHWKVPLSLSVESRVLRPSKGSACMCRFVLVEEPDITGIPAFTQNSTYGYYPVTSLLSILSDSAVHALAAPE